MDETRIVAASRDINADAASLFELIADPAQHPRWDGNDNLVELTEGRRVRGVGEVFVMMTTKGNVRDNRVVEFEEGRRIAWCPGDHDAEPAGHLWRWEFEPGEDTTTTVTHTYDWTDLHDERREIRARATHEENLMASIDRLAALAEQGTDRG